MLDYMVEFIGDRFHGLLDFAAEVGRLEHAARVDTSYLQGEVNKTVASFRRVQEEVEQTAKNEKQDAGEEDMYDAVMAQFVPQVGRSTRRRCVHST